MLFYSRYTNYEIIGARPYRAVRHPATGDIIDETPALHISFGEMGPEIDIPIAVDPETGEVVASQKGALIRGHYYDTEAAQQRYGWDDETREMVERVLLRKCEETPEFVKLVTEAKLPAPWPTYDTASEKRIPMLAQELDLVQEAHDYERQNQQRPELLEALEAKLRDRENEAALVADDQLTTV